MQYYLCLLAEAYAEINRLDDGLGALAEALRIVDKSDDRYCEVETYRVKGELLLRRNSSDAARAEDCFRNAVEVARKQSAKSLELRSTTIARLLRDTDRRDEARTMLAEIYNWFTEGFDTPDLKDAKALLDELSTPARSQPPESQG